MKAKQVTIKTLGPAGSGKTFVMMEIMSALKERGFTVVNQTLRYATENEMTVEFDPVAVSGNCAAAKSKTGRKIETVEIINSVFNGKNSDGTEIVSDDMKSFRLIGFVCNSAEIANRQYALNDALFEAAVSILADIDNGLHTSRSEKTLRAAIDALTGNVKAVPK